MNLPPYSVQENCLTVHACIDDETCPFKEVTVSFDLDLLSCFLNLVQSTFQPVRKFDAELSVGSGFCLSTFPTRECIPEHEGLFDISKLLDYRSCCERMEIFEPDFSIGWSSARVIVRWDKSQHSYQVFLKIEIDKSSHTFYLEDLRKLIEMAEKQNNQNV